MTVMEFLPQSPELNTIEHLWGPFEYAKAKHSVTSQEALWNTVKCWSVLPADIVDLLRFIGQILLDFCASIMVKQAMY